MRGRQHQLIAHFVVLCFDFLLHHVNHMLVEGFEPRRLTFETIFTEPRFLYGLHLGQQNLVLPVNFG